MKGKLFTLEKAPFLAVGLFSLGLAFRYFEDLCKALPKSEDFYHAFTLFVIFLCIGSILIGLYFGFIIAERHIALQPGEKTNQFRASETDASG